MDRHVSRIFERVTFRFHFYLSFIVSCRLSRFYRLSVCLSLSFSHTPPLCLYIRGGQHVDNMCGKFCSPCVSVVSRFLSAGLTARSMNDEFNSLYIRVMLRTREFCRIARKCRYRAQFNCRAENVLPVWLATLYAIAQLSIWLITINEQKLPRLFPLWPCLHRTFHTRIKQ